MAAYFDDEDLAHFGDLRQHHPALWDQWMKYYGSAFEAGLLTKREKILIGFSVALTEKCPYCLHSYTTQAQALGLTMPHLAEAAHAAASLRAGITMAHALVAHNLDKKTGM
ncbi:MAG: carboxymuconolactone decarboxylase family protein [Polyangiales bacterium]